MQADSGKSRTPKQPARKRQPDGRTSGRSQDGKLAGDDAGRVVDEAVIRLAEEQLTVDKRTVETGRVRVRRTTTERVRKVVVPLASDNFEVRRVQIGKEVKKAPPVRETRTEIIIPVVEEVLVVERRLVLREELHVRKVRTVERHTEQVTLRVQQATVERVASKDSEAGGSRAARSERPDRSGRSAKQPAQPKRRSQNT